MLVLGLKKRDDVKNDRIIIGNGDDGKDIRIELIDYKKSAKTATGKGEATVLISEPKGERGEREEVLKEGEKISVGPTEMQFVEYALGACRFGFDAPREVPIHREKIFHAIAANTHVEDVTHASKTKPYRS